MRKRIHYAFILDQSGSMEAVKKEVIVAFNNQLEAVKELKDKTPDLEIKITLCFFSDKVEFRFIALDSAMMERIKPEDYQPDSFTALYDAIGSTFKKIREHSASGDQVFFAIFTDGLENGSSDYTAGDVRRLFGQADEDGWEVKLFCRDEDCAYYKKHLDVSGSRIVPVSLNAPGLKAMENEICYWINGACNSHRY